MIDRSIFLHPPKGESVPTGLAQQVKKARELLERALSPSLAAWERKSLIQTETRSSAIIEEEFGQDRISRHARALEEYLAMPLNAGSMLRMHSEMMQGQPHAPPGRYRTVQVRVGTYQPPAPALVPAFMEELWEYAGAETKGPMVRAAWAHIQFETIHPFADGNGRTGRALISRILEGPLPLSRYILARRREYYGLLNSGDWLAWFTRGVQEETARALEERQEGTRG